MYLSTYANFSMYKIISYSLSINKKNICRYGICYSFNFVTKHALEQLVRSDSDGPDSGLSLVIDIEKSQYMRSGLSSKEGIVIALASPAELPNLLATPIQICK